MEINDLYIICLASIFFIFGLIVNILYWRIFSPLNTLVLIFSIYGIFGVGLTLLCLALGFEFLDFIKTLLLYGLISGSFINTYPAIESNIVTFRIQKLISTHALNKLEIKNNFNYQEEIQAGIEQMIASGLATYDPCYDKICITNKGRFLAKLFLGLGSLMKLKVGG